jgi:hypothetical protein
MDKKEKIQEVLLTESLKWTVTCILGSLSPILLALIPQVRDLMQSAMSFSLLLAITGVCISALALSVAFIYLLLKERNRLQGELASKPFFKLNVYWDKELNPLCPICKNILSQIDRADFHDGDTWSSANDPLGIRCLNCNKLIPIMDDNGRPLTLAEAKKELSAKQTGS